MSNVIFTKDEIIEIFNIKNAVDVFGISRDSRTVKNGDMFVAIHGENFDGHDFIRQAFDNGAVLVLASNCAKDKIDRACLDKVILVDDTVAALKKMAEFSRNRLKKDSKVIAITGSVGKTTTKDMLAFLLSKQKKTFSSIKNFNSQIGLPLCLCLVPKDSDFVVLECGMSDYGQISELVRIAKPNISMLTDVAENHLGFFDNVYDIAQEKSHVIKNGQEFCVLPMHSKYFEVFKERAIHENVPFASFGMHDSCAALISKKYFDDYMEITFELYGDKFSAKLNSFKTSFVYSFLECITCIKKLGLSVSQALDDIAHFMPLAGRGKLIKLQNNNVLIDDTYNASPASIKDGLSVLQFFKQKNRIAVLGDIGELGEQSVELHENLAASIISSSATSIVLIGQNMFHLYKKLTEINDFRHNVVWFENIEPAFSFFDVVENDSVFFLKASRFMAFEKIAEYIQRINNVI